jgi:hypothetical protein
MYGLLGTFFVSVGRLGNDQIAKEKTRVKEVLAAVAENMHQVLMVLDENDRTIVSGRIHAIKDNIVILSVTKSKMDTPSPGDLRPWVPKHNHRLVIAREEIV